jgi:dihydrofolate reductase
MGKLVLHTSVTANSAYESPSPETWLELDNDSADASLHQLVLADALVLGRKTFEGLAAVWPHLGDDPAMGHLAGRVNSMPKYVASRTLSGPLAWNATLIDGDLDTAIPKLKEQHAGNLIVSQAGEFADHLVRQGHVDEFWFWVSPHLWPSGPRIYDGVGPVQLQLISTTTYRSGVVWLRYRPAGG